MVRRRGNVGGTVMVALLISTALAQGSNLNKSLADTEGRRRAGENGLRQIKMKSAQQGPDVRALYTEAATEQNAWLDAVTQAVQQPSATAPDVTTVSDRAATTFVAWVAARNKALGEPVLAGGVADSVKRGVVQDLTDIAAETWKANRRADEKKRSVVISGLKDRLRWKTWDELQ
jgi:hypothetical protein